MLSRTWSVPRMGLIGGVLLLALFAARAIPAFAAVPTITNLNPATASTAGGTVVTVTGTGFAGTMTAKVDVTDVAFTPSGSTSGTFTAPAHAAGAVNVTVTNTDGTSGTLQLTYADPPTVTALSPNTATTAGGVDVTV